MNYTQQANQWLRRFKVEVTSNSNRLFANGRQQVRVSVTLEARDGHTISDASLDSLKLFVLDDDGIECDLEHTDPTKIGLMASSTRDERFEYHGHSGQIQARRLDMLSTSKRRHFYVTTTLPGGSLCTLYARIQNDEEVWVDTRRAPFVSSVTLEPVTPVHLDETHFALDREDAHSHADYDLDVWHLRFANPNYRIAANRHLKRPGVGYFCIKTDGHASTTPVGRPQYITKVYTLHAFDVGTQPHWVSLDRKYQQTLTAKPDTMTLLRARLTIRRKVVLDQQFDSIWAVIDQHGNEHLLKFLPGDNGNTIRFTTQL
jgi:hypothetical protein